MAVLRICSRSRSPWRPCSSCSTRGTGGGDSDASAWCDVASVWGEKKSEGTIWAWFSYSPVWSEYQDTPLGKHIHLNFNLLVVIGLIHSVDWTYHPRLHWRYLMCHNWSVIAPCFLLLLHLLMNYARLGATWQHPDKTFTANKQMKWVRSQSLTLVNGLAELSRMQIKASTSVTATAMLNAFIFQGGWGGF